MVTQSSDETIPSRVEIELQRQERTVSWLAKKALISPSYAWRMLRGERPLTDHFKRTAAEHLGVPVDELFAETVQ